jgi:hypothetical protein
MKACSGCKSVSKYRMKRKGFARFIRGSKAYAAIIEIKYMYGFHF